MVCMQCASSVITENCRLSSHAPLSFSFPNACHLQLTSLIDYFRSSLRARKLGNPLQAGSLAPSSYQLGMEDLEEEPEIAEFEEVGESGKVSRLSWMLNAGLRLGKKVVIAGIVVSSAPVVLPPLVVISALGFAISVPYGVVFASYVGTEKLMSKLLPSPVQYPEIEYEAAFLDEEEKGKGRRAAMDDDGIDEMRMELVDNNEEVSAEVGTLDDELSAVEVYKEKEERMLEPSENENPASSGMEEGAIASTRVDVVKTDDHDLVEGRADELLVEDEGEKNGMEEGIKSMVDPMKIDDDTLVVFVTESRDNEDRASPIVVGQVSESTVEEKEGEKHGLEETAVHGDDDAKTDDYNMVVVLESREGEDRYKALTIVEGQIDKPLVKNEGENKVQVMKGRDEMLEEENAEVKKSVDGKVEGTGIRGSKKKTFLGRNEEQEGDEASMNNDIESIGGSLEEAQKPFGLKELQDVALPVKSGDELSGAHVDGQEGVMPESEILINNNVRNIDRPLEKEQKLVNLEEQPKGQTAEDATVSHVGHEMNEKTSQSGRMLTGETTENTPADNKESQLKMVTNGGEYSAEMATIIVTPEQKHEEVTPQSKGEEDAPAVDSGLHSNEAVALHEDIWKKINAIRTIVGFTTPRQNSYFEELKALYLFTGIEPPSSSMDSSDLSEFNKKLSFLMSVIGVK